MQVFHVHVHATPHACMSTVNVAHGLVRHTDILSLNSGNRHRESLDAILFTLKNTLSGTSLAVEWKTWLALALWSDARDSGWVCQPFRHGNGFTQQRLAALWHTQQHLFPDQRQKRVLRTNLNCPSYRGVKKYLTPIAAFYGFSQISPPIFQLPNSFFLQRPILSHGCRHFTSCYWSPALPLARALIPCRPTIPLRYSPVSPLFTFLFSTGKLP